MAKRPKPQEVKLPPPPEEKTVVLTRAERQALVGLLSAACSWDHIPMERKRWLNDLSDKIMSEEEAAAELQALGFTIVEKARG